MNHEERLDELKARCARIAAALKPRLEALGWTEVKFWQEETGKHGTWHASGKAPTGELLATDEPTFGPDGALYRIYGAALEAAEEGVG